MEEKKMEVTKYDINKMNQEEKNNSKYKERQSGGGGRRGEGREPHTITCVSAWTNVSCTDANISHESSGAKFKRLSRHTQTNPGINFFHLAAPLL